MLRLFSIHCLTEALSSLRNVENPTTDICWQRWHYQMAVAHKQISTDIHSSQSPHHAISVNFKEVVYSATDLPSGAPPCHIPAARGGQCPAQFRNRNRRSMGWGGMYAYGRPTTAGNFEPAALTAMPSSAACRLLCHRHRITYCSLFR